ncbi:DUF3021 family protein [Melissococcus plutonius]|uniref:DUF3021 family protein n=1 Tax=Melissococcus plutonius TaxID=33970 RepID=UPI0002F52A2C|nr:DUF3021 family protein [Melissococcus plutonius]AIM25720.1 hypothetical protein MEPL_c009230 [Melissococcus plutonius S1]KMT25115.1 hypothetical protein MEPL2_2c06700 [Melissococcus plutonius]KMT26752.1 hypothetical protein MEPL3_2c04330 [Melissococcus plutonius]KMT28002.1 hypothetical protein MEPL1_3c06630 [Melissococcus plutonius]KMT29775.1 hypothetical protein MEPL4_3c06610 [Melissococcus plutonius]
MKWRTKIASSLGMGSFIYLALIYFNGSTVVTHKTITMVFLISIFTGVTTSIFEVERISFLTSLIIHYSVITLFVCILYRINYPIQNFTHLILSIAVVYFVAYSVVIFQNKLIVRELNHDLKKNQRDKS